MLHRLSLLAVVLAVFCGPLAHTALADDPPRPDVAFAATSSVVEEPAAAEFVATWDPPTYQSPYKVQIVDELGTVLNTCSVFGNTSCTVHLGGGWSASHDSYTRTLRAQVVQGWFIYYAVPASVEFRPHQWHLGLGANPSSIEEPANATITASVDNISQQSPYQVVIKDENGTVVRQCSVYGNPQCAGTVGGWQRLHDATDGHYTAEVLASGDNVPFAHADTTLHISPRDWQLTLTPSAQEVEVPAGASSASVALAATTNGSNLDSAYRVRIMDDDSQTWIRDCRVYGNPQCTVGATGDGLTNPVRHFHAEVYLWDDGLPYQTAATTVYFHDSAYAVDSINIDKLADKFDTALALCISLNGFRLAPNSNGGSTNDYAEWCLDLEAKGWSVAAILAAAGALYGDDLINWLLHEGAVQNGEATAEQVDAPGTMPPGYEDPVSDIQNKIRLRNSVDVIPDTEVPDAAKQCEWLASRSGNTSASDCRDLPIFVVGRTANADVTEDIWRGVHRRPEWVKLTYLAIEKRTSWYQKYPQTDDPDGPKCIGSTASPNVEDWTACDEFPWQVTEEGGDQPDPALRPYLRIIDYRENSGGGGEFNTFLDRCHVREAKAAPTPENGGGQFLVVPMPEGSPIPTRYICNDVRG